MVLGLTTLATDSGAFGELVKVVSDQDGSVEAVRAVRINLNPATS